MGEVIMLVKSGHSFAKNGVSVWQYKGLGLQHDQLLYCEFGGGGGG
jgi:hypothetical protein